MLTALAMSIGAAHAAPDVQVIATGLDNPRGLAFGPGGALYVAEAGSGGTGTCIPAADDPSAIRCYGETGALTRIDPAGRAPPHRVVRGLPSIAGPGGFASSGPVDVSFRGASAYVVMGWGGNPAFRHGVGAKSDLFGTVLRVLPNGTWFPVADVSAFEQRSNPAGGPVDSNPYGALALPGREIVADAGGNGLLEIRGHRVRSLAVLPAPLPGDPVEPVPTSVIRGPDGWLYVGQLTGAPFFRGVASVYRLRPDGSDLQVYASGFTAIVDLAFDCEGALYVLEIASGLIPGPGADPGVGQGRLLKVSAGLTPEIVLDGLVFPGGVAVGRGSRPVRHELRNLPRRRSGGPDRDAAPPRPS